MADPKTPRRIEPAHTNAELLNMKRVEVAEAEGRAKYHTATVNGVQAGYWLIAPEKPAQLRQPTPAERAGTPAVAAK